MKQSRQWVRLLFGTLLSISTEMTEAGYSQKDWQSHYENNDLGWDLGQVSPPFVKLWQDKKLPLGKVLIPGCGRGHEVAFLADKGFDVTAVDFSQGAITYLKNTLKEKNSPYLIYTF